MSIAVLNIPGTNRRNVLNALPKTQYIQMVGCPQELEKETRLIILPGVGHYKEYLAYLDQNGWRTFFQSHQCREGSFLVLGICAGFHALCRSSEEALGVEGLGVFDLEVKKLDAQLEVQPAFKCPNVGLQMLQFRGESCFYLPQQGFFSHSFGVAAGDGHALQTITHGIDEYVATIQKDKFLGVQFHPELSGEAGVRFFEKALCGLPQAA